MILINCRSMDKMTKIDMLIANQAKFAEILVDFNGSKCSDPTKHAILIEYYHTLKSQRMTQLLDQREHKVVNKYWDHYWEELTKDMQ